MLHRRLTWALALVALAGCKKADSFARVTVDSTQTLTDVVRLHVAASIAGASSVFDVRGGADSGVSFSIPPARVFGLQIPATYGGTLSLHLEAYADGDVLLASGDGDTPIAAGQSRDVTVTLGATPADMAGAPDGGPVLTLSPPSFAFPLTNEGASGGSNTFTLKNNGNAASAALPAPTIQGAMAASFSILGTDCTGASLAPSSTCTVTVQYTPKSAGKISAQVEIAGATSTLDGTSQGAWVADRMPAGPADLSSGGSGTLNDFYCVVAADPATVFAGDGNGNVYRRQATTWQAVQYVGASVPLQSMWAASASNVYVVGPLSTVWRFNGTTWADAHAGVSGFDLTSVAGLSASSVYVGGGQQGDGGVIGAVFHSNGPDGNGNVSWATTGGAPPGVNALWADPVSGYLYAISSTYVYRSVNNGVSWSSIYTAGAPLRAIWGTSSTQVFAVGDTGTIVRYDGTTWHLPGTSVPGVNLHGVWGSATDDLYVVGDAGTILHSTGNDAWSAVTSGTTLNLYAISGTGAGDIYAVGQRGIVVHYQ